MNINELKRQLRILSKPESDASYAEKLMYELKRRATSLKSHYNGQIDFRFDSKKARPDTSIFGNASGYFVSGDIRGRYQFQSEYYSLGQELSAFGYSKLRLKETVDPAAISNLMVMVLEKRRSLEDRVMKLLVDINAVLKSIISITYELKELDRNLDFYDTAKSSDKQKAEGGELALKRIFVDNVDARKGGASMISLSRSPTQSQAGPGFLDIVAQFYSVKTLKDIESMQKNKLYKDVLKNRFVEYEKWKEINSTDLRNRKAMLLQYLKSQIGSFDLYTEWASQYMSILQRINMPKMQTGKDYISQTKIMDISEAAMFSVSIFGYKPVYLEEYDVAHKKLFGGRGIEVPVEVSPKSDVVSLLEQGHNESSRSFIYKRLKKYGPEAIAGLQVDFSFKEKQTFMKELPQPPQPQYEGTLDVHFYPYCFTLDEWYLFKKAATASIQKSVFGAVDKVSINSLNVIRADLDKYLKEAEKKKEPEKKRPNFALFDIYSSFKQDIFGIAKGFAPSPKKGGETFDPELYEIMVNKRFERKRGEKDIVELGLAVASSNTYTMYSEYKRRLRFHNPLSKFDIF